MTNAKKCDKCQIIYGSCQLLSKIHKRIFKDCKPNHFFAKEGVKFEWTSKCEENFQQLKDILKSVPILKIAYSDGDFVVCTDACKEGLGGFLTQKDYAICYESRKLKEHERNYATHGLQLATILHSLKMWRHYLMGRRFELRKDQCGLKHLFGQLTLNSKQTRWLEFMSEYDFEINHIKGKENEVADALNIRVYEMHISSINMFNTNLKDIILEAANLDQRYLKIIESLQQDNINKKLIIMR
jgi:hypothetical protein